MKVLIGAAILLVVFITGCSKNTSENKPMPDDVAARFLESECEGGDDEDPQPILKGTVVDSTTQDSMAGVCVRLETSGEVFVAIIGTDENGHYYFNHAPSGDYNLVFNKLGYVTKTTPISIVNTPQTVNAQLRPLTP